MYESTFHVLTLVNLCFVWSWNESSYNPTRTCCLSWIKLSKWLALAQCKHREEINTLSAIKIQSFLLDFRDVYSFPFYIEKWPLDLQIRSWDLKYTRILAKLSKWLAECKRREVSLPTNILNNSRHGCKRWEIIETPFVVKIVELFLSLS